MANFGVTAQGFKPKRLADLLSDVNTALATVKDPQTGEYLDPASDPLIAQINQILLPGLADCWEAAYQASVQFDPTKASGACLDGTVQLNGIQRFPGTKTQIQMLLRGTGMLAAGQIIANDDASIQFLTDTDVAFVNGSAQVSATCTVNGAVAPAQGTITNILTPSAQWVSAQNIATITIGTDPETDEQLRIRQQTETGNTSYRQIEAIEAAVANIAGVVYCRAYQNKSATDVDSRDIPPKSVCVLVSGGNSNDIAAAIFKREPAGMGYYGDTAVGISDRQGVVNEVSFQRPNQVTITAIINISITDASVFPSNGAAQIAAAIVAYAQFSESSTEGIPPGAPVINSRLYTPINTVPGHKVNSVLLSRDGDTPAETDITIAWNEVANFITKEQYFTPDSPLSGADLGRAYVAGAPMGSITVNIS